MANLRRSHRPSVKRIRAVLDYDPARGRFTWKQKTSKVSNGAIGSEAGCISGGGGGKPYRRIGIDGALLRAAQLAFVIMEGRWPKRIVDHIDGDTLNDRWRNLREATYGQNGVNRGATRASQTGVKGVYPTRNGSFVVFFRVHVGTFKSKAAAARAHQRATALFHGAFAHHRSAGKSQSGVRV